MQYDNFLIYATYTILYANDTACNAVLELEKFIENEDKETKKIYRALKRRALDYIRYFNNLAGEHSWFTSDFFSMMDDCVGSYVDDIYSLLETYISKCGAEKPKLYAKLEQVRMLCHIAVEIHNSFMKECKAHNINTYNLQSYRLGELKRVSDNLSSWTDRHFKAYNPCNINDNKELIEAMHKANKAMMSFDNFTEAYNYSCNKNNMNGR